MFNLIFDQRCYILDAYSETDNMYARGKDRLKAHCDTLVCLQASVHCNSKQTKQSTNTDQKKSGRKHTHMYIY